MCTKEQRDLIRDFKKYSKEVTATKKSSQELLIRTKINTKSGELTSKYTPPAKLMAQSK